MGYAYWHYGAQHRCVAVLLIKHYKPTKTAQCFRKINYIIHILTHCLCNEGWLPWISIELHSFYSYLMYALCYVLWWHAKRCHRIGWISRFYFRYACACVVSCKRNKEFIRMEDLQVMFFHLAVQDFKV